MSKLLRWITRGLLGFGSAAHEAEAAAPSAGAGAPDEHAVFEKIDAKRLGASEFRLSGSMRADGPVAGDFAETLPACTHRVAPSRPMASLRHAA